MNAGLRRDLLGCAFVLPWLIALAVFIGYPFFSALYFSLCDFPPMKGPLYIGADNYRELAGDMLFQRSLGVTFLYAAIAIPLGVLLAMTLAMLLNARIRGQSIYRVIYFLPHLVPTVVVAILWLWIFNPDYGLLNLVLRGLFAAWDGWTACFFSLDAARAGRNFFRLPALALLLPVLLGLTLRWRWPADQSKGRQMRRLLVLLAGAGCALSAAALLNAGLTWLSPATMRAWHQPAWLTDSSPMPAGVTWAPSWALWALILMSLWGVGQMAVIYLAKLQDVPEELYEAADIDGAGWWHKTRHITIPLISPVILFNVVMAIIGTFQIFAEPYIMTRGGPDGKTRFLAMFIYDQAFQYQRIGYASAVAWVLFLIIVALTVAAFWVARKRVYYAGR